MRLATAWKHAPAEMSDHRGGAQRLAPVRNPLLERALTSVGQLLQIDLFEILKAKLSGP
jgi:hypothetical protein